MKKTLLSIALVLAALGVLGIGIVSAQGFGGRGPAAPAGDGPMHNYMVQAYADALNLTPAALGARLDAGETAYQVALLQGIAADRIPSLLADARSKALDAAVADGVITSEQADWMKSRGFGRGGYGNGYGMGAGMGPCNGTGQPIGPGMGRGGRWSSGQ